MELINQSDYYCNQCEKHATEVGNNFILLNDNLNKTDKKLYLCTNCLIEAVLMVRPIKFDKQKVNEWLMMNVISDDNSANEEGLSEGLYSFDVKRFIEFVLPFFSSDK